MPRRSRAELAIGVPELLGVARPKRELVGAENLLVAEVQFRKRLFPGVGARLLPVLLQVLLLGGLARPPGEGPGSALPVADGAGGGGYFRVGAACER